MQIPQNWRLNAQRYKLIGSVCEDCGATHFPPRAICYVCAQNGYAEAQPALDESDLAEKKVRANGHLPVSLPSNPA